MILLTVRDASSIWRGTHYPNSRVYYKRGVHSDHPNRYIRFTR